MYRIYVEYKHIGRVVKMNKRIPLPHLIQPHRFALRAARRRVRGVAAPARTPLRYGLHRSMGPHDGPYGARLVDADGPFPAALDATEDVMVRDGALAVGE